MTDVTYDDAVSELYQAPHASFVAERKRLADALKADGDKAAATKLGKLPRPTISAWVVNQLYWHARDAFDALMKTAEQLRRGDLAASNKHREAIAKLRQRASSLLEDAGHAATEATLRRVTQTLAALAATGGFDPDPPGALAADRDPPGFEAIGIGEASPPAPKPAKHEPKHEPKRAKNDNDKPSRDELAKLRAEQKQREQDEAEARREAEREEKRKLEEARARLKAERHRLEAALRTARGELEARERELKALEKKVAAQQKSVEEAQSIVDDLERKLDELDN